MIWTDERVAKLRELWPDKGLTAAQIAIELGDASGRSSVIGKANRLGLGPKPTCRVVGNRKKTTRVNTNAINKRRTVHNFGTHMKVTFDPNPEPFIPKTCDVALLNIPIMDIRDSQCKYIAGDDHLCCGHPVKPGHSWCPAHCAIVYQSPNTRTEKQKVHDARLGMRSRRSRTEATGWMAEEAA